MSNKICSYAGTPKSRQLRVRNDVEIRDYVVLQNPRDVTDCLPPPRTLILDFTMTHTRDGRSQMSSLGQLTHIRRSDGAPEPDGAFRETARTKIRHYRQPRPNRLHVSRSRHLHASHSRHVHASRSRHIPDVSTDTDMKATGSVRSRLAPVIFFQRFSCNLLQP